MKKAYGFSLLELMIVIALIAIMLLVAAPNITKMVKNNRLTAQANSFVIALNLARSEAIKRNLNVILCRSADGASCAASGGWGQGWIVYVDADETDGTGVHLGDEILRAFPKLSGSNTLTANNNFINRITYTSRGFTTNVGTLVLCDDRDNDGDIADGEDFRIGKGITIARTGRPQLIAANTSGFTDCATP